MSKLRVNNVIMYRRWKMGEGRGKASSVRYHLRSVLAVGLLSFLCQSLLANVTVTEPTGGNGISADKALNSTNGAAFTALGNIVIAEGVKTDFANGASQTLILTLPYEWRLNAGVGTVSFTTGRNISAASILVGTNSATVTYTVSGTAALDTLTIGSLQVQALDGTLDPFADNRIMRTFDNPGTAVIAGTFADLTVFGQVYQTAGAAKALAVYTQTPP